MSRVTFGIELAGEGSTFEESGHMEEIARILNDVKEKVEDGRYEAGVLFDTEDKRCGRWWLHIEEDEE